MIANTAHAEMTLAVAPKEPGRLKLSSFIKVAHDLVEAVRSLESADMDQFQRPADWLVKSSRVEDDGTFIVSLVPESRESGYYADRYSHGLSILRSSGVAPDYFSFDVLRHTDRALKLMRNGVRNFEVTTPETKVDATPEMVSQVRKLLRTAYSEYVSLDGYVRQIAWAEDKPRFVIIEPIAGRRINCIFEKDRLEAAKAAFPHRVEVAGIANFNAAGQMVSIKVDDFQMIPPDDQLPDLADLHSVNITDGISPDEFVKRMRNGE